MWFVFYFLLCWNTSYVKRYLVFFPTIKESQIQSSYFPETKTWQWKLDHLSRCHFLLNFRDFPASHGSIQGSSKLIFSRTKHPANPRFRSHLLNLLGQEQVDALSSPVPSQHVGSPGLPSWDLFKSGERSSGNALLALPSSDSPTTNLSVKINQGVFGLSNE